MRPFTHGPGGGRLEGEAMTRCDMLLLAALVPLVAGCPAPPRGEPPPHVEQEAPSSMPPEMQRTLEKQRSRDYFHRKYEVPPEVQAVPEPADG